MVAFPMNGTSMEWISLKSLIENDIARETTKEFSVQA